MQLFKNEIKFIKKNWKIHITIMQKLVQKQSNQQYFLEVDIQYLQSLHSQHSDLPILPERIKIEKLEKLIGNLRDKIMLFT